MCRQLLKYLKYLISYLWWSLHRLLANDCRRTSTWMQSSSGEELLTAPLRRWVVFSWRGSRSQKPWALTADASTVPSRLNVFSRGRRHKCFHAFLVNVAWVSVFNTYAAVAAPLLQTQLKMHFYKKISGVFSLNICCILQLIVKFITTSLKCILKYVVTIYLV